MKIYQMLSVVYDQPDTFNSIVEADGKYEIISFKGKKDKDFFINKLGRLPRHHMSQVEKVQYLGDDYKTMLKDKPEILKEMILSKQKKKRLGRKTIGLKKQQVCVITATDRSNNIFIKTVTAGTPNSIDVDNTLASVLEYDAILVTDDHPSYKYMCRSRQLHHIVIPSEDKVLGPYNLARINSLHSAIDRFFICAEYMPATKYLDL